MSTASRRFFLGLAIPAEVGCEVLRTIPPSWSLRRVKALEDLHLTLKFIGNTTVAPERILEGAESAARIVAFEAGPPLRLVSRGVGVFPNGAGSECRIFWADLVRGPNGEEPRRWLARLAEGLDQALDSLSPEWARPKGEPFVPHITLARRGTRSVPMSDGERWVEEWREVEFGAWVPESLILYETLSLNETGARFRRLGEVGLRILN